MQTMNMKLSNMLHTGRKLLYIKKKKNIYIYIYISTLSYFGYLY